MEFYGISACKQNSFYFNPISINFQNIFYPFNSLLYVYTDSQGVRGPPTALVFKAPTLSNEFFSTNVLRNYSSSRKNHQSHLI